MTKKLPNESETTKAIIASYHHKLMASVSTDVIVVGSGPSGLTAAFYLAKKGLNVTLMEKKLASGGGIWGGAMAMNDIVVEESAAPILKTMGVRFQRKGTNLLVVQAAELASALCLKAIQAGVTFLNLMYVEDVCLHRNRISGVVANRSLVSESLPIDPLIFMSRAVVDATGHEANVVKKIKDRGILSLSETTNAWGEGPLNISGGEEFVVEKAGEVYPGLWVSGMSVCTVFGGPRMGPIFGGMLHSGKKIADAIAKKLSQKASR